MVNFISEESAFNCLPWLCHTFCAIITSASVGENLLYKDHDTAVIQCRCAMGPIFFEAVSYKVYLSLCLPVYAAGMGVQGCNSIDTLNFRHNTGPHSGPNSVLGHSKLINVSRLRT